jgi:tetratricopeptide (TPR) repeat protein
LEAAARGRIARHEAALVGARALFEHGYVAEAGRLFERALRYVPQSAAATVGLGQAFLSTRDVRRAAALLERGLELSAEDAVERSEALLSLAKILAIEFSDKPQAIARVREVPFSSERVFEARALEGQWCTEIGDVAGASLAYSRLRELSATRAPKNPLAVARTLNQAAQFEMRVLSDYRAAERHLQTALRLAPQDSDIQAAYRAVAGRIAEATHMLRGETDPHDEG